MGWNNDCQDHLHVRNQFAHHLFFHSSTLLNLIKKKKNNFYHWKYEKDTEKEEEKESETYNSYSILSQFTNSIEIKFKQPSHITNSVVCFRHLFDLKKESKRMCASFCVWKRENNYADKATARLSTASINY